VADKICKIDGCGNKGSGNGCAHGMCKQCYMKKWRRDHPKRQGTIARRAKLKNKYGISLEEYEEIFNAQKGKCAICRDSQKKLLCIDHDHLTGGIRGLLCQRCNTGLGQFRDNRLFLARAAEYLLISR